MKKMVLGKFPPGEFSPEKFPPLTSLTAFCHLALCFDKFSHKLKDFGTVKT